MVAAFDYAQSDIEAALVDVGVKAGDVVFVQSSLGMLGRPDGATNIEDVCHLLDHALCKVVGNDGTVVVPTYTYSFCEGKPFNVSETPATIGPFAEYFRLKPDASRSNDPIFSVAATGRRTADIISNLPHDCFGPGSVYDRLCEMDAVIVTVGLGMEYATFRHHGEQMAGIAPRFLKAFSGTITDTVATKNDRPETWLYYVPALTENCEAAGRAAAIKARDSGVAISTNLGRNQVWGTRANHYREFLMRALEHDTWFTSKGPAVDVIAEERKRANVAITEHVLDVPYYMSENARSAVNVMATQFNLALLTWRTGDRFGDWVVPENWQLRDAAIVIDENTTHQPGIDFSVCGNSASVSVTVSGAVLKTHLNREPQHNTDWALKDVSGDIAHISDNAEVMVTIDAAKSVDHLHVAGTHLGLEKNTYAVFMCLSPDNKKDTDTFQALIQSCDKDGGEIYVLSSPLAAIPVIASFEQTLDLFFSEPSPEWDQVKAILDRSGIQNEIHHYQFGAPTPKQEHA